MRSFALALLLVLNTEVPIAAEPRPWIDPGLVTVRDEELAFARVEHTATATQSLFMSSRFDDGHVLMFDLFEIDMPVYHRWGIYVLLSDASGHRQWKTYEFGKASVRIDETRLRFTDGTNTVEGDTQGERIDLSFPGFSCSLQVRNVLPPWRGGDGLDVFTPDGRMYLRRVLACPWGELAGWIEMDGQRLEVRGQALLERSTRVSPLNRQYQGLSSVRAWGELPVEDGWAFELSDITTNPAYGALRLPRLAVARAGRWLFTTQHYIVEPRNFDQSGYLPYPAPRTLEISARDGGYSLDAEYRALTLFDVTDIISEIPPILRPLVRAFLLRPVSMRFLGELSGTLTSPDGTVERFLLHGPFEYLVLR